MTGGLEDTEQQAESSATMYRAAIETCPDAFLAIDTEGRILDANDAYVARSGYTLAELRGMAVWELNAHLDEASARKDLKQMAEVGRLTFETSHRTKAGEILPLEGSGSFRADGRGQYFVFLRDSTRRKRAEALLEAQVHLSRLAVHATTNAVIQATVDIAERLTGSTIGSFHFVDPDQKNLTLPTWSTNTLENMCAVEARGAHYAIDAAGVWASAFHTKRPQIRNDYASMPDKEGLLAGHALVQRELVVPVLSGTTVTALLGVGNKPTPYTDDDVAIAEALASLTMDVVGRKHAEEELRTSEERFRRLYETMAQGVFYQNADGYIESANPAAERLLGLSVAEMRTRTSMDPRWHARREDGSDSPGEEHPSMVALRTGRPVYGAVIGVRNERRDENVWLLVNAIPRFRPGETKPWQVFVTMEDISEQRAALEARVLLERSTQQVEKLESLGVLAGGIAHDFNNLLTAIVGHIDLAGDAIAPNSGAQDDLAAARYAVDRATELCRQMLAYSGRGRFVLGQLTWKDILKDQTDNLASFVPPEARLAVILDDTSRRIEADANQLQRLVRQLVENAGEALLDGAGTLRVATEVREISREELGAYTLGEGLAPGMYAVLEVSDDGAGMDAATLARVFDPFFSTRFTGRGMGMPEVLGIVRAHKGAIQVKSTVRKGTYVRVIIPCLPDRAATPSVPPPRLASRPSTQPALHVLLVDDEPAILNIGRRLLEQGGLPTLVAPNGPTAIEIFRREQARIGVVVLDVTMPQMSGEEALVRLRKIDPNVRVLMASGFPAETLARQLEEWGVMGFIAKPYTGRELLDRVRAALLADAGHKAIQSEIASL